MTEQQKYTVVKTMPELELRRYEPHLVAEVTVAGAFDAAGSTAFRPLVSYIGGRNESGTKFAMTAPVVQQTQPDGSHDVAFVLPADAKESDLPAPVDSRVRTRAVDEEWAVATRFSGRSSESSFQSHAKELLAAAKKAGYEPVGPPRFARYDPPWTPWFMRRNEVIVPIAQPVNS